jgi:hypothetical protein
VSQPLTLADLISLEEQRGRYIVGPDLYPSVASYLAAFQRTDPPLLFGFREFVSVRYERTTKHNWPTAMLGTWGLNAAQVGLVSNTPGEPDAHELAIRGLFNALRQFAEVVDSGGLEAILTEFATLGPTL